MKKILLLNLFILLICINFVYAETFTGSGTHVIVPGDKIILEDLTIEIEDITNFVSIQIGDSKYDVGTKEAVEINSSLSVKAIGILVNDKRASFYVENRKSYNGDGSYVINVADTITATNGYQIKVDGAYAPYVSWWYELSLVSPSGELIYNFSHSSYEEVPIYSEKNENGEIVLYLKTTPPDATSTITIRSVENNEEVTGLDKAEQKTGNKNHIYYIIGVGVIIFLIIIFIILKRKK